MDQKVYLDVSIVRCPACGKLYADASWYILDMESDIQCSICGNIFNTRKNMIDRVLIKFNLNNGTVMGVDIEHHITDS